MTISSWRNVLDKLGCVVVEESIKDITESMNEEMCQPITENDKLINNIVTNKPINKLFNRLKKL